MEARTIPLGSKRIALFSDGTGNSSAKAQKTNVWRLFQALDQTSANQIAMYDDGVGTSSNKYLALLGGAFGWGLKRNVIDLYKFVSRNYNQGDEIYGFGFSRGAFTIRVLIGLIAREGLVTFRSEEELDRHAAAAYRSFRYKAFPSKSPIVWLFRWLRDIFLLVRNRISGHGSYDKVTAATKAAGRDKIPIRFLGLWDTVEAYGMPIQELKRGIDWVLWPMLFGDLKLTVCVKRAVHALSLDDERTTFHPLLWDEEWEAELAATDPTLQGRITQVWFAGVHSNVGGGYPEDQLSLIPLEWILGEAVKNGLTIVPNRTSEIAAAKSPYARLYDSRAGFAAYYRYSPRQTPINSYKGAPILVNVHWTVLMRMVYGSDTYAPITLPHAFNVLTPSGNLVNFSALSHSMRNQGLMTSGNVDLDDAVRELGNPDHNEVGLVWDTVFWRRWLYALTMALTLVALAFPWFRELLPKQFEIAEAIARGPIGTVVDALNALIPPSASKWKEALKANPLEFGVILIGIALTLVGSQTLEGRIHDRARIVWHRGPVASYRKWRDESRAAFRRLAITFFALAGATSIALLFSRKTDAALDCAVAAALVAVGYIVSVIGHQQRSSPPVTRVRNTLALRIARAIRENRTLIWIDSHLTQIVIPLAFAGLLVLIGAVIVNRATFDIVSSAGRYCTGSFDGSTGEPLEQLGPSTRTFTTDSMCWPSGLVLTEGHRYVITISTLDTYPTDRWFDRDVPTDVMGFATDSLRHKLARPLTRWWNQNWFKPIARIGRYGNDEYVLDSVDDVAPLKKPDCPAGLHMPSSLPIRTKIDENLAKAIDDCAPIPADRRILHSEIKARSTGELFIYVNDAILALPGFGDAFVANNSGRASVRVDRLTSRAIAVESESAPASHQ
jgi:uncharacterized protein (DUF2235 family)